MSKHTDFSRIFIDRPILATVLSALILVSGLMAIPSLPITEYPDVVPPTVAVNDCGSGWACGSRRGPVS